MISNNIQIKVNYDQFTKDLMHLDEGLKRAVNKSVRHLATLARSDMIAKAPQRTGNLKSNIIMRKIKNGMRVSSGTNTPFPYNFWVNKRPIRTIRAWWLNYHPVEYGAAGMNITGVPRYFDLAARKIDSQSSKILQDFANRYGKAKR